MRNVLGMKTRSKFWGENCGRLLGEVACYFQRCQIFFYYPVVWLFILLVIFYSCFVWEILDHFINILQQRIVMWSFVEILLSFKFRILTKF